MTAPTPEFSSNYNPEPIVRVKTVVQPLKEPDDEIENLEETTEYRMLALKVKQLLMLTDVNPRFIVRSLNYLAADVSDIVIESILEE